MRPLWDDVNARARGLASHLLGSDRLRELSSATNLSDLVTRLEKWAVHIPLEDRLPTAPLVETGLRRIVGRNLMLLARWCGPRREILLVVFEEEDLRSLRAVFRGAVAGIAPELRIEGLIPTPALPTRALEELAHLDVRRLGALLTAWNSPYAGPVARQAHRIPDLFQLELDLARVFLGRSLAAAQRGDRFLRAYAGLVVDLENLRSAAVLASERHEQTVELTFIAGGTRVTLPRFREAATAGGFAHAVRVLAPGFRDTALGTALHRRFESPADLENTSLALLMTEARTAARREPLSTAPVLHYVLSLRSELRQLQRVIWGLALGASLAAAPLEGVRSR